MTEGIYQGIIYLPWVFGDEKAFDLFENFY